MKYLMEIEVKRGEVRVGDVGQHKVHKKIPSSILKLVHDFFKESFKVSEDERKTGIQH